MRAKRCVLGRGVTAEAGLPVPTVQPLMPSPAHSTMWKPCVRRYQAGGAMSRRRHRTRKRPQREQRLRPVRRAKCRR